MASKRSMLKNLKEEARRAEIAFHEAGAIKEWYGNLIVNKKVYKKESVPPRYERKYTALQNMMEYFDFIINYSEHVMEDIVKNDKNIDNESEYNTLMNKKKDLHEEYKNIDKEYDRFPLIGTKLNSYIRDGLLKVMDYRVDYGNRIFSYELDKNNLLENKENLPAGRQKQIERLLDLINDKIENLRKNENDIKQVEQKWEELGFKYVDKINKNNENTTGKQNKKYKKSTEKQTKKSKYYKIENLEIDKEKQKASEQLDELNLGNEYDRLAVETDDLSKIYVSQKDFGNIHELVERIIDKDINDDIVEAELIKIDRLHNNSARIEQKLLHPKNLPINNEVKITNDNRSQIKYNTVQNNDVDYTNHIIDGKMVNCFSSDRKGKEPAIDDRESRIPKRTVSLNHR